MVARDSGNGCLGLWYWLLGSLVMVARDSGNGC